MADNPFLGRLGQYKEFIAILAAAIGGFVWFDNLVAKQDEVAQINDRLIMLVDRGDIDEINLQIAALARQQTVDAISCRLQNYMILSQRQLRLAQLNGDLMRRERELDLLNLANKIERDAQLHQTALNQATSFRSDIGSIRSDIEEEDEAIRDIINFLGRGGCDSEQ